MSTVQAKFSDKRYERIIWVVSIVIPIVVGVLLNPRVELIQNPSEGLTAFAKNLPYVNATINSLVSICLVIGFLMIKNGKRETHQKFMVGAFVLSALFLVSYVTYHVIIGHVPYCDGNLASKGLYYTILVSHIVLSVSIVPLASFSIYRAVNMTYERHKKLSRITFPLWLYVSVTGVIVVILNSPCY
ncbi:MAG: DUF420 domain-containing protein [Bacteroidia bacterium]|nr:DUF420 domain-containing protein [Bacteroidia bacterium]